MLSISKQKSLVWRINKQKTVNSRSCLWLISDTTKLKGGEGSNEVVEKLLPERVFSFRCSTGLTILRGTITPAVSHTGKVSFVQFNTYKQHNLKG